MVVVGSCRGVFQRFFYSIILIRCYELLRCHKAAIVEEMFDCISALLSIQNYANGMLVVFFSGVFLQKSLQLDDIQLDQLDDKI